jgi:hypothetical protein
MARFDKYNPVSGGFRAPLNASYTGSANVVGVGINGSGKVVVGAGVTGVIGVICSPLSKNAGDIIDVMTDGEIVQAGLVAGTLYTVNTTSGAVASTAPSATQTPVGWTVEADRLIVRAQRGLIV